VVPAAAYARYFSWYIDPADVSAAGHNPQSGIDAFYERYPLIKHAVDTVTEHYRHNIELACERVAKDWDNVARAFFPGRTMTSLTKIKTTGNDFHKGGKQVLILTFSFSSKPDGRVVYKPSGVEIDCRIVGNSGVFNGPGAVNPEGYTQNKSLTELINDANPARKRPGGFTSQPLPTYRILPYQRSSIPDTYGYIEFLTHEPSVDVGVVGKGEMHTAVGRKVGELDPADVAKSDWIVDNTRAQQVFFHQYGGLMAMAMAVSLCDLHLQNMIVHVKAPHLIDLEEALKKPMTRVTETYLAGQGSSPLGNYHDPTVTLAITGDMTTELKVSFPFAYQPAACVLYRHLGKGVDGRPAQVGLKEDPGGDPDAMANREALLQGLDDVFQALATTGNAAAKDWVNGLTGTIARFVPRATAQFADSCRSLYMAFAEAPPPTGIRNEAYDEFTAKGPSGRDQFFFRSAVRNTRTLFSSQWKPDPPKRAVAWLWPPYFAVEHPDHAWRDYLNCDVPAFYHFLGEADLRNSNPDKDKQKVNVTAARDWQNSYIKDPGGLRAGWSPAPTGTYFPESPVVMVVKQLDDLKAQCTPTDQSKPPRWSRNTAKDAFIAEALDGTEFKADYSRLALARNPAPKSASGAKT
jgi:hypothetical protein